MPFCGIELKHVLPSQLIENPNSIGEYIKKHRQELKTTQREVALIIGVSEDTIAYWEKGRFAPRIEHFPSIIRFWGYNPLAFESSHLGGLIYQYRVENGLSYRNLAKLTGLDPGSLERWEKGSQKSLPKSQKRLEQFLISKELS